MNQLYPPFGFSFGAREHSLGAFFVMFCENASLRLTLCFTTILRVSPVAERGLRGHRRAPFMFFFNPFLEWFLNRHLGHHGSLVGSIWVPFWKPARPKTDAVSAPQHPKDAPRAAMSAPRTFWGAFCWVLCEILDPFGCYFVAPWWAPAPPRAPQGRSRSTRSAHSRAMPQVPSHLQRARQRACMTCH